MAHPREISILDLDPRFRDECLQNGRIGFHHTLAKGVDVELNGGFHIRQGRLVGFTLAYHGAFESQGVGHVGIGMFLHYNFDIFHEFASL